MFENNPARFLVTLMETIGYQARYVGNGEVVGEALSYDDGQELQPGRTDGCVLLYTLSLYNSGGLTVIDQVWAFVGLLNWLEERLPLVSAKKTERYKAKIHAIKDQLDWEMAPNRAHKRKPEFNAEKLKNDFEHLADDLDERLGTSEITEEEVKVWLDSINEIGDRISASNLDPSEKKQLLKALMEFERALVKIVHFGPAAGEESLQTVLGMVGSVFFRNSEVGKSEEFREVFGLVFNLMVKLKILGDGISALPQTLSAFNALLPKNH